jgi:hypothetical protein
VKNSMLSCSMGMLHEPECSQLLYVYQVSSYMGTERADGKHFDGQTV